MKKGIKHPELLTIRMDPKQRKKLEELAIKDRRTLTSLVNKVLSDWIEQMESAK